MKGSENSIPEKNKTNAKCVKFKMKCEFVLCTGVDVDGLMTGTTKLPFPFAPLFSETNLESVAVEASVVFDTNAGNVSGKAIYTYIVSITIRRRENAAAAAKGFAAKVATVLRYAPSAGPKVKAIYAC